jgi:GR25 family glycosyltransferase involved in LPS biosynthesis
MKAYIAHYEPLKERKEKLLELLSGQRFDYDLITTEPSDIFYSFYFEEPKFWDFKNSFLNYEGQIPFRKLTKADISLLYKHFLILEKVAYGPEDYALVLEDDVLFDESFSEVCLQNLQNTPEDWDFIFIGNGCNLRIDADLVTPQQVAYLKPPPSTKCTDSFFIKRNAAQLIVKTFLPYVLPVDFEFNYQLFLHKMKAYWWEPPLVFQGSQTGVYSSYSGFNTQPSEKI